ncbi:MAG: hypothetical protein EA361_13435 [Bacteroidetes bacterium]|nr:MAG: hypothetical protein EA361_13435 [Bacteroidota bacterium]
MNFKEIRNQQTNKKVMKKHIHSYTGALLLAAAMIVLASGAAKAQQYHTIYWMQGIPQSSYSNPGLQPLPNYYVGFPGLSSVYSGFYNSGFAVKDLLRQNADGSLYIDDQNMLSKLKNRNYFIVDMNLDILSFGFRYKDINYLSFNISERVETRFGYSKDFMRLLIEGNDGFRQEGVAAQIGSPSFDVSHFREYGVGFSRKWTNELTAGVRAKVLQGMSNINFKKTDLSLFTGPDNYELLLNTNLLINKSFPFTLAPLEDIGDNDFEFEEEDLRNYLTQTANMGFAVDLGAVYQLDERFTFAASIRDLGFINWKRDAENFRVQGEVEFKGFDFNEVFGSDNDTDFDETLDSIIDLFNLQETTSAYALMMAPKFFVSAAYNLTPMHRFALLGRGEVFAGGFYPSITASYNFQPINRFGSTLSYSIIHGNYHNLGLGFHVNIWPVQLYVVADNYFPALQPHTFQTFNIHFGLNIAAGFSSLKDGPKASFRW